MSANPESIRATNEQGHETHSRRGFVSLLVAGAALVAAGCSMFGSEKHKEGTPAPAEAKEKPFTPEIDLLAQSKEAWAMPGATLKEGELHFSHLGREIVEQDGSEPQVNTPINLASHVEFDPQSDVSVSATLKDISGSASVTLYGRPPAIYDEHRFEQGSVRLTVEDGTIYYDQWDGQSNTPKTGEAAIGDADKTHITMERSQERIVVSVNGEETFRLPEKGIFTNGNIWFGADSENAHGSAALEALSAKGQVRLANVHELAPWPKDLQGFQEIATKKGLNLKIGAAISSGPLAESLDSEGYRRLAESGYFGAWTTENELKFQFVHPQRHKYSFEGADLIIARAEQCGIDVHGHALDFGSSPPRWLQKIARQNPGELQSILEEHIAKVVGRYKGRIKTWDVVNEPLAEYDDTADREGAELRRHVWHKGMGANHLAIAFRAAHKADPNAQLFMNEYGLERDGDRWDFFLQTVDDLLAQGVPLHGIGFQAHVYEQGRDDIDPEVLRQHIKALETRGLKVRISEIDVCERDTAYQAGQFAGVLKVALEEPAVIHYSTWGVTEGYGSTSWIDHNNKGARHIGDGLLFDRNGKPIKKAVEAIRRVLRAA